MTEVLFQIDTNEEEISGIIINAVNGALNYEHSTGDITVLVVDNEQIRKMNAQLRNIDAPTDVLSFPSNEGYEIAAIPDKYLGDIAISLEKAEAQAQEYGHSFLRELSFLAVHGTLHILGYDHMCEEDRQKMFARQDEILDFLEIKRG